MWLYLFNSCYMDALPSLPLLLSPYYPQALPIALISLRFVKRKRVIKHLIYIKIRSTDGMLALWQTVSFSDVSPFTCRYYIIDGTRFKSLNPHLFSQLSLHPEVLCCPTCLSLRAVAPPPCKDVTQSSTNCVSLYNSRRHHSKWSDWILFLFFSSFECKRDKELINYFKIIYFCTLSNHNFHVFNTLA